MSSSIKVSPEGQFKNGVFERNDQVPAPPGEVTLDSTGVGNWEVPAGVTKVCVVLVGAGGYSSRYGGSGAGGALAWANEISVTPGALMPYEVGECFNTSFTTTTMFGITVGKGGTRSGPYDGGGNGGSGSAGGGGSWSAGGGGGAGGYTGDGGNGKNGFNTSQAPSGAGGGGGGGNGDTADGSNGYGGFGGGVCLYGEGASGVGGSGYGGSGTDGSRNVPGGNNNDYGRGGRGTNNSGHNLYAQGGDGAIRIIWGAGFSFPNNAVIA